MLPFIIKKDVNLNRVSDELIIRVGSYRKHLVLPRHVAGLNKVKAKLDGKLLTINFTGEK
jgi:arsenite-transporting ATPase